VNKEFKSKWIKALRNQDGSNYKQGRGNLLKNNKYCCLGVACDLLQPETWFEINGECRWGDRHGKQNINYSSSRIPTFASDVIELNYCDQNILIELNDAGKSFTEIAQWIEENL
jgi:hypothetical protein